MRRTRIAALGTAGLVALGGVALFVPAGADAATTTTSPADRASSRLTALKDALKGLVSDGTLTQAQADKVADTLADKGYGGGPGGMGHGMRGGFVGPGQLASILGISVDELHTKLEAGRTLAQIAAEKKISKATLVEKLVAAAKTQLATAVKDGRLTQARADEIAKDLTERITEMVDRAGMGRGVGRGRGPGQGPGQGPGMGHGRGMGRGGFGDGGRGGEGGTTSPSPSPSGTASNSSFDAGAVVADV